MMNISFNPSRMGPFRLIELQNGLYQFHVKGGDAFEGTEFLILNKAMELGVPCKELKAARWEMEKHGHDVAEFGICGIFMYTVLSDRIKIA